MDLKNLIGGRIPSLKGTVFACRLREKLPEGPKPNFLVEVWIAARKKLEFALFLCAFTLPPLFVRNFWFSAIWMPFILYLEVSAWFYWLGIDPWRGFRRMPKALPPYEETVNALRESPNAMERDSIALGTVAGTGLPVLIPFAVLMHHLHGMGPSGTFKTWMMILAMLDQVIRRKDCVVFHSCLKGEIAVMHFLRQRAAEQGLPFRVITIDPNRASWVYNPMNQSCTRTPSEKTAKILQVFGLNTASTSHGENYWQSMSASRAKRQFAAFPECRSFREMDRATSALGKAELANKLGYSVHELEHGTHFAALVSLLADAPCMNVLTAPQLDVMEFIQRPGVCVLLAEANLNKALAAMIRRFLLFDVNASARKLGPDRPPVIFSTDECHEALDSTEMPIFKSCRELKISLWNAHQEAQDLQMSHDKNILPMVTRNSRVSITMGVRDAVGRKHLKEICGDQAGWLKSIDEDGDVTERENLVPRVSTADFDYVNNTPGAAFVQIHEPEGFSVFQHWFICHLLGFPCSREEYEAYRRMPWPDIDGGATMADLDPKPPTKPTPEAKKEKATAALAALAAIADAHRGSNVR